MKQIIIAATILLSSMIAKAEDVANVESGYTPPTVIYYYNNSDRAVWVTVYNAIGRIGDYGCLQPGGYVNFTGYVPSFGYGVRAEVKENRDCGGRTIADMMETKKMNGWIGIEAFINKSDDGNYWMSVTNGGI